MKNLNKAFTLLELMMVSSMMVMVIGTVYTLYVNMSRIYFRGTNSALDLSDAQMVLDILSRELRPMAEVMELDSDSISFRRCYEPEDRNDKDPVRDLNSVELQNVTIRARKDDHGLIHIEKKVDLGNFEPVLQGFASKDLSPSIFRAWQLRKEGFVEYDRFKAPHKKSIPLMQITLHVASEDKPLILIRKVFLPVIYANLPQNLLPREPLLSETKE